MFRLEIPEKGCGLEVKGKVLRWQEDQLLLVPKEERKRPNPQGKETPQKDPRVQVGETGPNTPIYGVLLFGVSPTTELLMETSWPLPDTSVPTPSSSHLT